ncbi:MAG: hypothetical protein ACLRIL_05600 [Fusicatenibacter saccharivorans]
MYRQSAKHSFILGIFISTVVNSLLVNGLALVLCLGYMYKMGWYMSAVDVLWVLLDEIFTGTLWKHVVKHRQFSTDNPGSVIRSGNDRKCRVWIFMPGAYMPISNFGSGLQESTVRICQVPTELLC